MGEHHREYHLRGVVGYVKNHYLGYGRRDGRWYVMDDLKEAINSCRSDTRVYLKMAFYSI